MKGRPESVCSEPIHCVSLRRRLVWLAGDRMNAVTTNFSDPRETHVAGEDVARGGDREDARRRPLAELLRVAGVCGQATGPGGEPALLPGGRRPGAEGRIGLDVLPGSATGTCPTEPRRPPASWGFAANCCSRFGRNYTRTNESAPHEGTRGAGLEAFGWLVAQRST